MNILLLSTYEQEGGAARASHRLYRGLVNSGASVRLLVQRQASDDPNVIAPRSRLEKGIAFLRQPLDDLPLKRYRHRPPTIFSCAWLPDRLTARIQSLQPDVVNGHWVGYGFLQLETLATLKRPIVLTLHDMWAFTGGCHYAQDCQRYTQTCGACPQLGSHDERDLSRQIWQRKEKAWQAANPTIVTPSCWMAECARTSRLFRDRRIEVIPNGIDLALFKPIDRPLARKILNLPLDRRLVLLGAHALGEPRKGFHLLEQALKKVSQSDRADTVELLVFGSTQSVAVEQWGLKAHVLGQFHDELSLALIYAAADAYVTAATQDNLPNTVMEAIACGTPCVAFDVGGLPDLIDHYQNGYLATPFDTNDFAEGILWLLEDFDRHSRLSANARHKAEQQFSLTVQANRYRNLFEQLAPPLP